jgi:hypothetical protein
MNGQIIYLSGAVPSERAPFRAALEADRRFGYLMTPNMGNKAPATTWGADTGCFTSKGGDTFKFENYLSWLRGRPASSNLFATAPDILADAEGTIARSMPCLPAIRALGFKAALVRQDGLEKVSEIPWSKFDCLFLGGRPLTKDEKKAGVTEWKLSMAAAELVHEAKRRGLWVHMGRVNSHVRLKYAAAIGCDSADGTFLRFAPEENYGRMCQWFDKLESASRAHEACLSA